MSARRLWPLGRAQGRAQGNVRFPHAGRRPLGSCASWTRAASTIAVAALAGLFGAAAAVADPASSADSAWLPLPSEPAEALANPLERRGREVFDQRCRACHGEIPDEVFGPVFLSQMPGTALLEERYRGELPAELEKRTDLSAAYIEAVVRDGLRSMPFFRPTELSDDDLEAVVAYLTRDRGASGR